MSSRSTTSPSNASKGSGAMPVFIWMNVGWCPWKLRQGTSALARYGQGVFAPLAIEGHLIPGRISMSRTKAFP